MGKSPTEASQKNINRPVGQAFTAISQPKQEWL